jgi:hypothetical protein
MLAASSKAFPIVPENLALLAASPYQSFGRNPYQRSTFRGLKGCGCAPGQGCGCTPGLGRNGGGGGGSHSGSGSMVGSHGGGLYGLGQTSSLDSIIQSAANWLGGFAQSQLPPSAAVPPGYGSVGGAITQLTPYIPYVIVGYLAYRLLK